MKFFGSSTGGSSDSGHDGAASEKKKDARKQTIMVVVAIIGVLIAFAQLRKRSAGLADSAAPGGAFTPGAYQGSIGGGAGDADSELLRQLAQGQADARQATAEQLNQLRQSGEATTHALDQLAQSNAALADLLRALNVDRKPAGDLPTTPQAPVPPVIPPAPRSGIPGGEAPSPLPSTGKPNVSYRNFGYTVKAGDNWYTIANMTGLSFDQLRSLVGPLNALGVGQQLNIQIPSSSGTLPGEQGQPIRPPNPDQGPIGKGPVGGGSVQSVTIRAGENWNTVAARTGLSFDQLRQQVGPLNALKPGQVVTVRTP